MTRTKRAVETEADFQSWVTDLMTVRHWRYTHFRPAMRANGRWVTAMSGDKGFPDLVAVRGERVLVAELKSAQGKLSPEQNLWLARFRETGKVEAYLWYPWDRDEIEGVLA